MLKFRFNNIENTNRFEELIKVFLQPDEYEICKGNTEQAGYTYDFAGDNDEIKRQLFSDLAAVTGKKPKWGILTGIRPVKLAGKITDSGRNAGEILKSGYLLDDSKVKLTLDTLNYQRETAGKPPERSLSLYLGIPFCPTRCLYCSFTSNQVPEAEIERYLEALHREIRFCGEALKDKSMNIESVYFGGGTPTTLNQCQLDSLLGEVEDSFDLGSIREYTVEAGRPDTITLDKLRVLKDHGVDRISINPQTMKAETLELIGRRHTIEDVYLAFAAAHKAGISTVNTDLIAGLPEESFADFADSLDRILELGADNITLHTLAVKRASRLKEYDENFNYRDEQLRESMLVHAHETLEKSGFKPYYLYRQKHTSGNTENTGFCRDDKASVYNIRIMEEAQSILALGAGGISKIYFPAENRLERVANVSNYEIYIERLNEMLERKSKGFFAEC